MTCYGTDVKERQVAALPNRYQNLTSKEAPVFCK